MEPTPVLVVIALICWLIYALFVWIRGVVHRRGLPELSVAPGQLEIYQGQAFREMCRRAANPGRRVMMTDYFAERGWNRADVMRILAELLKHKMIVAERSWIEAAASVPGLIEVARAQRRRQAAATEAAALRRASAERAQRNSAVVRHGGTVRRKEAS